MHPFPLPQRLHNDRGAIRTLGVELEFAGLEIERICELIVELYGGERMPKSRFEQRVVGTRHGDFAVEIDLSLLKERSYMKFLDFMGVELEPESLRQTEDTLARIASTLVPHEVAAPPMPMTAAHELERLRERLQREHALGTRASIRYAFGLQFNPEIPAFDAATILAYLRAFMLLADWLSRRSRVALTRRLSPFINDFPQQYIRRILDPDYAPTVAKLIDDYIESNPTRNRPLDMLPLFAHLDAERVRRDLDDAHVKIHARPTFHYRLPNCLIDDPEWTLAQEWAGWVTLDDLAQNREKISMMSSDYIEERGQLVIGFDEDWAQRVESEWLAR